MSRALTVTRGTLVGANATVLQRRNVGDDAIVRAGAILDRSVLGQHSQGHPAR